MPKPLIAALLVLAAGGWGACGAGGCGDTPETATTASAPAQDGRGAPGSGQVEGVKDSGRARPSPDGSRFDTASRGATANGAAEQAQEAASAPVQKLAAPAVVYDVLPGNYDRVLKSPVPALVMVFGPHCADCELALPSLRGASRDLNGRVRFYRIDASADGASTALPADAAAPWPSFLLYDGGRVVSRRKGLPFAPENGETRGVYQKRLYRWFRDAAVMKNLGFGGS